MSTIKQVSRAHYWDMLEALPPENYVTGVFTHFRMMEYNRMNLTNQYGHFNGVYLQKEIDVNDESTWLTVDDFIGLSPFSEADDAIGFYIDNSEY